EMTLSADGDVSGSTTTKANGAFGVWLRGDARVIGPRNPGAAANLLYRHGTPGSGEFTFDPPTAAGDDYTVRGTFRRPNQSALLQGGYFTLWTGLRLLPRPGDFLAGPMFRQDLPRNQPTLCYAGSQRETLNLLLPEGRELGTVPPDLRIDTEFVRYR